MTIDQLVGVLCKRRIVVTIGREEFYFGWRCLPDKSKIAGVVRVVDGKTPLGEVLDPTLIATELLEWK